MLLGNWAMAWNSLILKQMTGCPHQREMETERLEDTVETMRMCSVGINNELLMRKFSDIDASKQTIPLRTDVIDRGMQCGNIPDCFGWSATTRREKFTEKNET